MKRWRFRSHPALRGDITEAARYYKGINPNLAGKFTAEVRAATRAIRTFPESRREYMPGWRRIVVKPFPYLLIYAVRDNTVIVTALVHVRRDPQTIQAILTDRDAPKPAPESGDDGEKSEPTTEPPANNVSGT